VSGVVPDNRQFSGATSSSDIESAAAAEKEGSTTCGLCETRFQNFIRKTSVTSLRLYLRSCNCCCAVAMIGFMFLGFIQLDTLSSYSVFVINVMIFTGSLMIICLELKSDAFLPYGGCGIDKWFQKHLKFFYYAKGRAYTIMWLGILNIGTGFLGAVFGLVCVLPYACLSRIAIRMHDAEVGGQGDRLITTDTSSGSHGVESDAQAATQEDEEAMKDAEFAAEAMSDTTLRSLINHLHRILEGKSGVSSEAANFQAVEAKGDTTVQDVVLGVMAENPDMTRNIAGAAINFAANNPGEVASIAALPAGGPNKT